MSKEEQVTLKKQIKQVLKNKEEFRKKRGKDEQVCRLEKKEDRTKETKEEKKNNRERRTSTLTTEEDRRKKIKEGKFKDKETKRKN